MSQWKQWSLQFPWLRGNHRAARCAQCPDFYCKRPQKCQLVQHEGSRKHTASCSGSPSVETFSKMLDERSKGVSLRSSAAGRSKSVKMMWCCNEALKDIIKLRVRKGVTSSLTQDGQGSTLSVRMCTVSHHRDLSLTCHVTDKRFLFHCPNPNLAPRRWRPSRNLHCFGLPEAGASWFAQHCQGHQPGCAAILHCEAASPEGLGRLQAVFGPETHAVILCPSWHSANQKGFYILSLAVDIKVKLSCPIEADSPRHSVIDWHRV